MADHTDVLLAPGTIDETLPPEHPLSVTLRWVRTFLAEPDPMLGRKGAVCPFVPRSLQLGILWFATPPLASPTAEGVAAVARDYVGAFLALEPSDGDTAAYKSILLVFPGVSQEDAPELVDGAQAVLKPAFVDAGLMIGQFHAGNPEPGLHNPSSLPLRSPVPLLAIRWMVPTDLPFLAARTYPPATRLRFLRGYMRAAQRMLAGPSHARVRDWAQILDDLIGDLQDITSPASGAPVPGA